MGNVSGLWQETCFLVLEGQCHKSPGVKFESLGDKLAVLVWCPQARFGYLRFLQVLHLENYKNIISVRQSRGVLIEPNETQPLQSKTAHFTQTLKITVNTKKRDEVLQLEKNERESAQLLCFYRQLQNWLIHFQELLPSSLSIFFFCRYLFVPAVPLLLRLVPGRADAAALHPARVRQALHRRRRPCHEAQFYQVSQLTAAPLALSTGMASVGSLPRW